MTFEEIFSSYAQIVERRLGEILQDQCGGDNRNSAALLGDAMRYGVLNGGKRLRPFLTLQAAHLFDVDVENALDVACAVECVHCYSLIHDDLPAMDDDDVRRGVPTVHKKYDEATAILAGDALLTLAFELLAKNTTQQSADVGIELVSGLARASGYGGMVGGQALDLAAEDRPALELDEILRIQTLKTGALIEFSLDAGALIGGATDAQRKALGNYGRAVGLAFQIADDLLDVEGAAEKVGKAVGKDERSGKKTFISHFGVEGARARVRELEAEAVAALEMFGERAGVLSDVAAFVVKREH